MTDFGGQRIDNIAITTLDFDVTQGELLGVGKDFNCLPAAGADLDIRHVLCSAKAGEVVYLYSKNTTFYVHLIGKLEEKA